MISEHFCLINVPFSFRIRFSKLTDPLVGLRTVSFVWKKILARPVLGIYNKKILHLFHSVNLRKNKQSLS